MPASRRLLRLVGLGAVVLLAGGCAAPEVDASGSPSGGPTTAAPTTSVPAATPTPSASRSTRPALCSAARPKALTPFPFNRDTARRGQIVRLGVDHGGTRDFEYASVNTVAALLEERFLDPDEYQNESPDFWEIFRFMCRHPDVRAFGYAVAPDRTDYRVSLDAIESDTADPATIVDARKLCVDAETDFTQGVDCFWD